MQNFKSWLGVGLVIAGMVIVTAIALAIACGFVWVLWAAYNG